ICFVKKPTAVVSICFFVCERQVFETNLMLSCWHCKSFGMTNFDQLNERTASHWTRDGVLRSPWQEHTGNPFASDEVSHIGNRLWDVAVVGGGITGLSTALRLQEAGKRCIVLEAHQIGFGTTGGTTAHINTM